MFILMAYLLCKYLSDYKCLQLNEMTDWHRPYKWSLIILIWLHTWRADKGAERWLSCIHDVFIYCIMFYCKITFLWVSYVNLCAYIVTIFCSIPWKFLLYYLKYSISISMGSKLIYEFSECRFQWSLFHE